MARERMVTRTMHTTICTTMCMDVIKADVEIKDLIITGKVDNEKEMMKTLRENYETEVFKIVHVTETKVTESLYGMSEIDFMKYAKLLPPR